MQNPLSRHATYSLIASWNPPFQNCRSATAVATQTLVPSESRHDTQNGRKKWLTLIVYKFAGSAGHLAIFNHFEHLICCKKG